ncbi:hypothetical protein [Verrucosispora sp. WMMC514]|uniref:hypothetical protein n=1 Tax=Verrucosispora sp. WMMC514 TaxID=3015156 RepID=UPI00248C6C9D|nr:hypothetical protein [Verrucosispora sp. WMMC514]WBB94220.1 hypothetical protein O7597_15325 [Verrucosispora sp. WMMC514]
MTGRYAERTDVSSDRSRAEIERVLKRYGATAFQYGWTTGIAVIMFEIAGRRILFRLPLPDPGERRFTHTPGKGLLRDQASREREYEQAVRQRWRALALVIKAKLEAVAADITTVEQEFGMFVIMPDGRTVGEHVTPAIAAAYESGQMPALLPGGAP